MDDLVKRLREIESNHSGWGYAAIAASRIEELEAKLAKAVETLEYYNVAGYEGKEARTTLAELKGQNDE